MITFGRLRATYRLRAASVALLAVLLVGAGTDTLGLDNCSHHGVPRASAQETAGHGHHGSHAAPGAEQDAPAEPAGCTCIGDCAGPAILADAAVAVVHADIHTTFTARPAFRESERVLRPRYLDMIPYSNAPPSVRSAV